MMDSNLNRCRFHQFQYLLLVVNLFLLIYLYHNIKQYDNFTNLKIVHNNQTLVSINEVVRVTDEIRWTKEYQVPNVVHYNWYADKNVNFKFHHMLSVLSAAKYIKPTAIRFHCNRQPAGKYWDRVKKLAIFEVVDRPIPETIFGIKVKKPIFETSHSNVDRLKILYEYGGIYMDLDVLATSSFDDLRHFVITVGYEANNTVCGGIIVSSKRSLFLRLWMNSFIEDYQVGIWAYNSGRVPLKLSKRYPQLVHIEPTRLNRPNFHEFNQIWGPEKFEWRKNYAIHTWYRLWKTSKEFKFIELDEENIKTRPGTFGEIARSILYEN